MSEFFHALVFMAILAAIFRLGWQMALRRRARELKALPLVSKNVPYMVQNYHPTYGPPVLGPVAAKSTPASQESGFNLLHVAKEGVVAFHENWRAKYDSH